MAMQSVQVTGPGTNEWVDIPDLEVGENDVLLKIRACGLCGSDAFYTSNGGVPPRIGSTILGHEPAAEVVSIGAAVDDPGLAVGDHVVMEIKLSDGILGNGGAQGALAPFVVVRDYVPGKYLKVIPKDIPWEVAALNEPMAVSHHGVNRSGAKAGDKAVVFGAGPVGLGAVLSLKSKGVEHVVVVARGGPRAQQALDVGADAVINAKEEDVVARLIELHGEGTDQFGRGGRADTNVYIDAAGSQEVIDLAVAAGKWQAVITILAIHKEPVKIPFGSTLTQELEFRVAAAYPSEIFEVTDAIVANPEAYAKIVSHTVPFERALDALEMAKTPGLATKVVVTFN